MENGSIIRIRVYSCSLSSAASATNHLQGALLQRAYEAWERYRLDDMDAAFAALDASEDDGEGTQSDNLGRLRAFPFAAGGTMWAQRGGLGMNAHKYMRNVLPETEFFLGQALLFPPDSEAFRQASVNLPGCWAKRTLESARYLLVAGAGAAEQGDFDGAQPLLYAPFTPLPLFEQWSKNRDMHRR